ncbi:ABC transporter ATP-binding protein [Anaerosacchariphilus polymeriproducens]|uniref:ABC transporter ATP-binding protein n=1 Tax=Anaerosacchariphilus polymeriproducens TaxID=1812858 RepID=A0A371ATD5_9FIRM|nr:ABC transporter ATP-binding protein [Anaerosacchariphilus polymeriproducens]RDU22835.1 ABC transporter ATP-binding protein [Anaerosacchariphilus polymeriproducens]
MNIIEVNNITKDYGNKKGVFDVSFNVRVGEVLGFLGPNGAGKTTTIRQLMGFIKPDRGRVAINGMNCFKEADKIQINLGYLPGEIAFMDDMTGIEFIKFIANMKELKDFSRAEELMKFFELDPRGKMNKMSKGMKQKIGIVCAFMQNPEILILDEPTSGLDPLMQNKFIELILKEKENGKTILMSSHIFEEIEKTCDRAAIIKEGRIVTVEDMEKLKSNKRKTIEVQFDSQETASSFVSIMPNGKLNENKVIVEVKGEMDEFIKKLSRFPVKDLEIKTQSLEEFFMHFYGGEK